MADKKISQLPIGAINSDTIFPFVTSGITSQNTFENIASALEPYFSGGSSDTPSLQDVVDVNNTLTDNTIIQFPTASFGNYGIGFNNGPSAGIESVMSSDMISFSNFSVPSNSLTSRFGSGLIHFGGNNKNFQIIPTYSNGSNIKLTNPTPQTIGYQTHVIPISVDGNFADSEGNIITSYFSSWTDYTPTMLDGFNVTSFTIDRAISKKEGDYVSVNISLFATTNGAIGNKNLIISLPYTKIGSITNLGGGLFGAQDTTSSTSEQGTVVVQQDSIGVGLYWRNTIATDTTAGINISFMYQTNA
jgi:hypothetical protein